MWVSSEEPGHGTAKAQKPVTRLDTEWYGLLVTSPEEQIAVFDSASERCFDRVSSAEGQGAPPKSRYFPKGGFVVGPKPATLWFHGTGVCSLDDVALAHPRERHLRAYRSDLVDGLFVGFFGVLALFHVLFWAGLRLPITLAIAACAFSATLSSLTELDAIQTPLLRWFLLLGSVPFLGVGLALLWRNMRQPAKLTGLKSPYYWGVAGGALLVLGAAASLLGIDDSRASEILSGFGMLSVVAAAGLYIRDARVQSARARERAREAEASLLEQQVHAQRELLEARARAARQLMLGRDEERSRLALELHDDVAQELLVLARTLPELRDGEDPRAQARELIDVVRELSHARQSSHVRFLGVGRALELAAERIAGDRPISVEVSASKELAEARGELGLHLYRIGVELMHNAVVHGEASYVEVSVECREGSAELVVVDTGKGFDVHEVRREMEGSVGGLKEVFERVDSLGGAVELSSAEDGTEVRVRFPLGSDRGIMPSGDASRSG